MFTALEISLFLILRERLSLHGQVIPLKAISKCFDFDYSHMNTMLLFKHGPISFEPMGIFGSSFR